MKNLIRICSVVLALIILGSLTVYADTYFELDGFVFDINSKNEVVIHEYNGNEENVVIPKKLMGANVVEIDDYAFFENNDLKSVSFANAEYVKKIGINAFYGCTNLKSIDLPPNLSEIGFGLFQDCTSLESVVLTGSIAEIPNQTFYNCTSLKRVVIPEGTESVGDKSFSGCASLKEIEVPDSVTSISDSAFENTGSFVFYCSEGSYAESFSETQDNISYKYIREYVLGDANLDGTFNILDATTIQKYKVGKAEIYTFRGKNYADVDGSGEVTIRDATLIQMKIAHMIDSF